MSRDRLYQSIYSAIASAPRVVARYLPVWMILFASLPVHAQQLSVRRYDVSDGLAHSHVSAIHQDRKGYLWFGTQEGLSRFDGYRFTNYGVRDGPGHPIIYDIAEDRRGHLWIATNDCGGVSLLIDDPQEAAPLLRTGPALAERRRFISFRVGDSRKSNCISAMLFDQADNLWLSTDDGVYRAATSTAGRLQFNLIARTGPTDFSGVALADRRGRIWFGVINELIQIDRNQIIRYGPEDGVGRRPIRSVVEDRQGRVLVANEHEVFEFIEPPTGNIDGNVDGDARGSWRRLPLSFRPDQLIRAMLSDSSGALWIGTSTGLIMYRNGKQTLYTAAQGLSSNVIRALTEDRDGNLWIGAELGGACKLSGEAIVSITRTEGLPEQNVARVIEDRRGRIYASIANGLMVEIVEGRASLVPGSLIYPTASYPFQDSHGAWWVIINKGLYRFEGPELQLRRGRKLSSVNGIPGGMVDHFSALAEDRFGRLWIMFWNDVDIYRLDPARHGRVAFERIPLNTTLPNFVIWMMSDRAGTLWLGGHEFLARLMNGKTAILRPSEGLPETRPRSFFQDSRGWVWVGLRYKGVSMTKDPGAESPQFVNYSTEQGLSSDAVWSIAEDDAGRIYLGTGKGLDQLDPATGRIRHFNTQDGLAGDRIFQCLKDRNGNIWVVAAHGLSRLNPRAERIADYPPPIYLSRTQVAGEDLPIAETGALHIPELELPAARNNLLIEYVGLSFRGENRLRYQYMLEGVDGDWGAQTESRSVNYARLAPGSYRFLARAINQEGVMSAEPAVFQFRILPPLWQRWWFLALAATLIGLAVYALFRYRVARLVELERVRTRIATDLHDDIGAGLSRVAILSEVVKRQVGASSVSGEQSIPLLTEIADSARGLVESMREIVWAIDPRRDALSDVVSQVRQFASDVLEAKAINWEFQVEPELEKIKLDPERRRHLFLIFKEALHNIARHAGCKNVRLSLTVSHNQLSGEIRDDGRGFTAQGGDAAPSTNGHGLENMRRRAAQVGGKVNIESWSGQGTCIKLMIPLKRQ